MLRAAVVLSLAPLFSSLLAGCVGQQSSCGDFKGGTFTQTVELTADEYAQAACGDSDSGSDTSTGGGSTGGCGAMLTPDQVCQAVCGQMSATGSVTSCSVGQENAMELIPIECELPLFCEGRRHLCVRSHGDARSGPSGAAWLARAAHDEAASVHSFLALAAELVAHGAPASLLARIHAAADDETRHAAAIGRLAGEYGATVVVPHIVHAPPRALLAIAVENAAEGCVRETWAALSAAHQASHAQDPQVRSIYRRIAADETRHAELAWAIDTWIDSRLPGAQRDQVEAARRAAVVDLRTSLAEMPFGPELAELGLPTPGRAGALVDGLNAGLWERAA